MMQAWADQLAALRRGGQGVAAQSGVNDSEWALLDWANIGPPVLPVDGLLLTCASWCDMNRLVQRVLRIVCGVD